MRIEERETLRQQVLEAGHSAAQIWPLTTFAYRNPLRGYEHLPFDEAVREGARVIGGEGYLSNEEFRGIYRRGRITADSLRAALERTGHECGPEAVPLKDRTIEAAEVDWLHLTEGFEGPDSTLLEWTARRDGNSDLLDRIRDLCGSLDLDAERADAPTNPPPRQTLSDWLDHRSGSTVVDAINEQMTKWSAAFLDEGLAGWGMPSRAQGFYASWRELAARDGSLHFLGLRRCADKIAALPETAEEQVAGALQRLEIPTERWSEYQSRMFAQLPGWTGFVRWRSENPSHPSQQEHPIDVVEYLAVRAFYEVELVDAASQRTWGVPGTLTSLAAQAQSAQEPSKSAPKTAQAVGRLYQLAKHLELTAGQVDELSPSGARTLLNWLERFPEDRHGRVWLEAYEESYRRYIVGRLAAHQGTVATSASRPSAQLILCIDARSEPFRRHVEAQGPYETFGYAGFFGVPISHQAFDSHDRLALCPVLLKPGRSADEAVRAGEEEPLQGYASGTRWRELADVLFHDLKQSPSSAFMLVDALGLLFSIGLVGKTLVQRPYARLQAWLRGLFRSQVHTHVQVGEGDSAAALPAGFSLEEQANFVEGGLRMIGLTERIGRLVVVCGHGAESENNPYAAAYNCGACGGAHGDPNARAFATMANTPEVRRMIAGRGLAIPEDTWFLAAKHDTTTDRVSFYDVIDVPESHAQDLRQLDSDLLAAGGRQASERLQRLPDAPRELNPRKAVLHAVTRSVDWANPRPEWGLSSNAAFLIGRRSVTKGLDLESRVFLHSYDPIADESGEFLEKIMTAPLIVGEWINMEYYFSSVSPWVYGSGSKVIHNVVGGVGVMLGSESDLQGGLPIQGVFDGAQRYHEPMRLLAIIEAPTERISNAIRKHAALQTLFHNQWVNLLALDPATREFHRYNLDSTWEPISLQQAA